MILAEQEEDKNDKIISWVYSHDYGNGLKLMEHSWVGNGFVGAFETLIFDNPQRVVWGGDYADNEANIEENLYRLCIDELKINPNVDDIIESRFVINHSKQLFVDKTKGIDVDSWVVNPLPLLTAEGNGRGGGDYYTRSGEEDFLVGSWARDIISVSNDVPSDYEELIVSFSEE